MLPWGRVHAQLRDDFLQWLVYTSVITECAATLRAGHQMPAFWHIHLKMGMLRTAPQRLFFKKGLRGCYTASSYLCIYASRRQAGRGYRNKQKTALQRTGVRYNIVLSY